MKRFTLTPDACPTRRQFSGRKAQRFGANFQNVVAFSAARLPHVLALEELPPCGARFVGRDRSKLLPMPCDFMGCFVKGPPLFIDAKSCGEAEVSFDAGTLVKDHQLRFLQRMARAGAVAGFLVEAKERGKYLWVGALNVTGRESIRFAHNGVLGREWVDLGELTGLIWFERLRGAA